MKRACGKRVLSKIIFLILAAFAAPCALRPLSAQEYVYPNKKLADEGLLEYRRYTLEEAQAYEKDIDSFEPFLLTGWSEEQRLTEDESVFFVRAITSNDTIFCTFQTIIAHMPKFISSYDRGNIWNPVIELEDTAYVRSHYFPDLANDEDDLIIGSCFYKYDEHGYNLGYFRSSDSGISWSELVPIFPYYNFDQSNYGSLSNIGRRLYFAYNEYDHDSIYVLISPDWGETWNGRGKNVAFLSSTPQEMTVRASGDNVYLVWVNESSYPVAGHYSRSTDQGLTWSDEIVFTEDERGGQMPYIAICDTHVVVNWVGYQYSPHAFTGDLFIKQSFDGGATWGEEQVLTDSHRVWMGSVYIEDSLIVATWQDTRFEGSNNEAMVRYSTDSGSSWSEEERLSYGDYDSHAPIACRTGDRIHVLWGDMRREAPGLYYCYDDLITEIADDNLMPEKTALLEAYPNPFNSTTVITYSNLEGGDIAIYNITGQLVKVFHRGGIKEDWHDQGQGKVTWDATDAAGERVSSGIYFVRAKAGNKTRSIKVIFLK